MKNILVIGGAGYVGTSLCDYLVKNNYNVTCFDAFWFGNKLDKKVKIIKGDLRKENFKFFKNIDVIINLAYLANDPLCEIDARGTWEIGPLAVYTTLEAATKYKVKKYIFASSGSVYGLKKEKKVTEKLGLDPITDYNKSKMICEQVLKSFSDRIKTISLRPATVCGFSKRLRLDVVLNIFSYQAFFNKKITIFGGNQVRPLLHIKDMIYAYEYFIKKNITGTFNVGFENYSVEKLATMVKENIDDDVVLDIEESNDNRSYHINSDKIFNVLGFKPKKNIDIAIKDLIAAFKEKKFSNTFENDDYFNIKKMQKINLI